MTLEARARVIADKRGRLPGSAQHRELEAFALQQLREAVDEAVRRCGDKWTTHGEMNG